jgi:hypothetical protein
LSCIAEGDAWVENHSANNLVNAYTISQENDNNFSQGHYMSALICYNFRKQEETLYMQKELA